MQAHQFSHSSSRAHGACHAGAIQIDHDHLGLVAVLPDEQVAEVKIAMTSTRIVEAPDRGAGCRRGAKYATAARARCEPDSGVGCAFFE
jgi:hypothetical protein